MGKIISRKPWAFLDEFRGTYFTGDWPTLPEVFEITTRRFMERNAFTVFEPDRITLTYAETLEKIKTLALWLKEQLFLGKILLSGQ